MERVQELVTALTIPGLPGWTGMVVVLALGLVALAFALMPFSVFGLKSRLEMLELQLEDVQAELRALGMRLAEQPRQLPAPGTDYLDLPLPRRSPEPEPRATAPVPPPAMRPEPRLDWPTQARR